MIVLVAVSRGLVGFCLCQREVAVIEKRMSLQRWRNFQDGDRGLWVVNLPQQGLASLVMVRQKLSSTESTYRHLTKV